MAAGDSIRRIAKDTYDAARNRRVKIQQESQNINEMRRLVNDGIKNLAQLKKEVDEKTQHIRRLEQYVTDMNRKINDDSVTLKNWDNEIVSLERQAGELEKRATGLDKAEQAINSTQPPPVI